MLRASVVLVGFLVFPLATEHIAKADTTTISGRYRTKVAQVANNCETASLGEKTTTLTIEQTAASMVLRAKNLPAMRGQVGKRGKFSAKAKQSQPQGAGRAEYALSGHVTKNQLSAVLVVELFDSNKPGCTQSYSLQGSKAR